MINQKNIPFLMWLCAVLFFGFQFVFRLWAGINMEHLMSQFHIEANDFGRLASYYYYGYAGGQIPIAILLDKLGARRVISVSAVICGVASILFAYTEVFELALASRFLVGLSSAAGFLGVSKISADWFSKDKYAKMIGYSFSLGLLGAIFGGKPIALLLEILDYTSIAVILGIISISIGILCMSIIRDKPTLKKNNNFELTKNLHILKSPVIWLLGISNLLMVGALEGLTDVWGIGYLTTAYNFVKSDAAGIMSCVFIGMLFGGPILAMINKKINAYLLVSLCGFGLSILIFLLLGDVTSNYFILSGICLIIGILCCYQVLVFSIGGNLVSSKDFGFTVAFLNSINMIGGSFFHTIIGTIVSSMWTGERSTQGIKTYSIEAYRTALHSITFCAILGGVILLLLFFNRKNIKI